MTQAQLDIIKHGRSLVAGAISIQDINRRQEWIDRHLLDVLDIALKQHEEVAELNQRLIERREAYEEHIAKHKLLGPLVELVKQWGIDKGITGPNGKGTLLKQAQKMMEEAKETMDAVEGLGVPILTDEQSRKLFHDLKDGIGDTTVTLIILADLMGWTLAECLQAAYDEIKGRTGAMVDGTFVKDSKEGT